MFGAGESFTSKLSLWHRIRWPDLNRLSDPMPLLRMYSLFSEYVTWMVSMPGSGRRIV